MVPNLVRMVFKRIERPESKDAACYGVAYLDDGQVIVASVSTGMSRTVTDAPELLVGALLGLRLAALGTLSINDKDDWCLTKAYYPANSTVRGAYASIMNLVPYRDGSNWCVLLGEDVVSGLVGWGSTPEEAVDDFERRMRAAEDVAPARRGPQS